MTASDRHSERNVGRPGEGKIIPQNARTPGCVNFTVEVSTCKINGATGSLTPPHLGPTSKNVLKTDAYKNRVITYVREKLPRSHPLIVAGWHNLPPHVHAIA